MAYQIRRVDYYYTSAEDRPGEAYKLLNILAQQGINLLAFTAVPTGPSRTQLALFPEEGAKLEAVAGRAGMQLDGPQSALLVQGDDRMGALAEIHEKLMKAGVNVYASTAVTDGKGCFGYLVYVRQDEMDRALGQLHTALRAGLSDDITWVDLSSLDVGIQRWAGWPHPNPEGHQTIGAEIAKAITG